MGCFLKPSHQFLLRHLAYRHLAAFPFFKKYKIKYLHLNLIHAPTKFINKHLMGFDIKTVKTNALSFTSILYVNEILKIRNMGKIYSCQISPINVQMLHNNNHCNVIIARIWLLNSIIRNSFFCKLMRFDKN